MQKIMQIMTLCAALGLAASTFAQSDKVFEQENETAKQACANEDTDTAIGIWEKWVQQGNMKAQNNLGMVYLYGCKSVWKHNRLDEKIDLQKALPLLEKAADAGLVTAQYTLGKTLIGDAYSDVDKQRGLVYLEKAAQQGDVDAQNLVAWRFATLGDDKKSFYWNKKAAEQGDADSQLKLAGFYERGEGGVQRDCKQANLWLNRAVAQDYRDAVYAMMKDYETGTACLPQDSTQAAKWRAKYEALKN